MGGVDTQLSEIVKSVERSFIEGRRVISFQEYLDVFAEDPVRACRDAAAYMLDMFDHFGVEELDRPWGTQVRHRLFDLPWTTGAAVDQQRLVGQEGVQGEIYRALRNFVRGGRVNRLMLLHGPNGSAKSTVARCIAAGLEHYSSLDEGALYCFDWVFPNQTRVKGHIGFSEQRASEVAADSYAKLPEDSIDARVRSEVRDHPLFLLPFEQRQRLIAGAFKNAEYSGRASDWILKGGLSHKSQQVMEALLASYHGDLSQVLRHVRVTRYFISRRYRVGIGAVGPQMAVDAGERQLTADRSLSALPPSLQSVPMYEAFGEIIDASGGMLEFSDLLKRPLDAFKYLQMTAETGEVPLNSQTVQANCVMLASANEVHLAAFREHPDFDSFRGRFELIRMPYLRRYPSEKAVYDGQVVGRVVGHVAPHATETAAMFAVLTRMLRPEVDRYPEADREVIGQLTAIEKAELYATGQAPTRLEEDARKRLRGLVGELYAETESQAVYEGITGASPREMRTLLFDAAQRDDYGCLSPLGVLKELDDLCARESEFSWLSLDVQPGGYHDHRQFREYLKTRLLDRMESEFRVASGLVDDAAYDALFERYILQISYWSKGEKVRNPLTSALDDPDEGLMREVEALLGVDGDAEEHRHHLMGRIAAWAIDHPGQPVDHAKVFADELARVQASAFEERRIGVAKATEDVLRLLRQDGDGLDAARRERAEAARRRLTEFGYEDVSAAEAAGALLQERFRELLKA